MKNFLLILAVSVSLIIFSTNLFADVAVDWRTNHLHHLEKITVGPWDNFGATVSDAKPEIIYTQDKNQILSLFKHNVESGESEPLSIVDGDVKQPAFNKSGTKLAFTYFGDDAQGDVCVYQFEKQELNCINSNSGMEHSPFWLNDLQVGYLKRSANSFVSELVIYDLNSGKHYAIAEGIISAPTASGDGKYILFDKKVDGRQDLRVYDVLSKSELVMPQMNLPGNLGFTAFSTKNDYVYFSYYLNDTNLDQKINADDNSVIYRLPFDKWKSSKEKVFPEQLTSVDYNCKFPKPAQTFLYLTCAFEGSLDIYRLPLTGMVAAHWQKPQLEEAHLISRSYEERLLLLNAMRYRYSQFSVNMLQRIIGDHVQIGEIAAARYYIAQLLVLLVEQSQKQSGLDQRLTKFYQVLDSLLFLRSEKNKNQNDIITIGFRRIADEVKQNINSIAGNDITKVLASAFIEKELGNKSQALNGLDAVSIKDYPLEIQKYLAISLYEDLLSSDNLLRLTELYPVLFNDMDMSFEFRLFYAFKYLQMQNSTAKAIELNDELITPLFQADTFSREIVLEKDERSKVTIYKKLSKLIKSNNDNILLRKALHVRVIQIFSKNKEYKYMELLSRHWLTVSRIREMEFFNVADQYSKVNKDKAYGFIHQGQLAKAFNTFYPIIRQTNDLEAYYQFLTLGMDNKVGQKDTLDKSIALLKKQKLLGENEKYTKALHLLMEAATDPKKYSKALDDALSILKSTSSLAPSESMHELLLGFIYHRKMQASQDGYVYDKRFYQNAHYHYMLALDLAQNNGRISATILQNLGWLHKSVGQYALAVNYFEQRQQYPFLTSGSEKSLHWVLSSAYFYNNQALMAYEQIQQVLTMAKTSEEQIPYLERAAFYALQAKKYKVAVNHYEAAFASSVGIDKLNLCKMKLAYGYSLAKAGDNAEALLQFKQVLSLAEKLRIVPASKSRLIGFNPVRQKLLANGFLAKLSESVSDKEKYLNDRIVILTSLNSNAGIGFDEAARLSFLAKDYQALALLYEENEESSKMINAMNKSFDVAVKWVASSGDNIGPVIYRVLINYLSMGVSHPAVFRLKIHKKLEAIYRASNDTFKSYPYPGPGIIYQQAKMNILWQAFERDVMDKGVDVFKGGSILADENVMKLSSTSVEKHDELNKLVTYFSR